MGKRFLAVMGFFGAGLLVAVLAGFAPPDAWLRAGNVWFRSTIYAGPSATVLTDANGQVASTGLNSTTTTAALTGLLPQTVGLQSAASTVVTAHAGGGLASATALTQGTWNNVAAVATGGDSVTLGTPVVTTLPTEVCNTVATNLALMWAPSGVAINNGATGASFSVAAGKCYECGPVSASLWGCVGN
jgi:NADH:ubiquinone oxidoreductase subunit F (NADH-binding)